MGGATTLHDQECVGVVSVGGIVVHCEEGEGHEAAPAIKK